MNKKLIVIGSSLLAIILCLFIAPNSKETSKSPPTYKYQLDYPKIVTYSKGNKEWDIDALEILVPKDEDDQKEEKIILKAIKDGKLFDNDQVKYTLDADRLVYIKDNKNIKIEGNIKLETDLGEEIQTEKLDWIDEKKEFMSDSEVVVKLKDGNLKAKSMKIDMEDDWIDFSGQVEMNFELEGDAINEE